MAKSQRWSSPMEHRDLELPRPLRQKNLTLIRSRWLYTVAVFIFAGVTLDQYSRHDPWFWLGLFCVVSNCHLVVRAWLLKWRQQREYG